MLQFTPGFRSVRYRTPDKEDGAKIWRLIKRTHSLDDNSMYCNLLQCTHFAGTCAIAELRGKAVGWLSAYIPPEEPDTLFVWQVTVRPEARGRGVAKGLVRHILKRPVCADVRRIRSTITPENEASWALFGAIAEDLGAEITDTAHFEREAHFDGAHDTEHLVTIGPFSRSALARAA